MNSSSFEFLYIIGRGGFGKVWKVKSKQTQKCYALKQMSKVKIIDKKSIKSINSERDLLSELYSPFIVNMHYAFQDKEYLYLIMDYLPGGDLRYHISIHKKFSEEQTRFFICGIILSLEYIHSKGVIHRDIKPENLVLDDKGYVRITDFGIAKKNLEDNSSETSGTPGYMSPEVINSKNHSFPADYFALGVIGYEFMKGERPYNGKNRKEIKEEINSRQAEITMKEEIKNNYKNIDSLNDNNDLDINEGENWSKESINFINKLLMRNPEQRLGYNGIKELKDHSWLRYYPWNLIQNKTLPSPFIPNDKGNFDTKYCKGVDYIGEETQLRYEEIFDEENYDACFKDFYYNIDEDKKRNKEIILSSDIKNEDKFDNNTFISNCLDSKSSSEKYKNKSKKQKIKKNNDFNNNKKSNFILINFNINNITNNNIERNKINNIYLNNNKNNNNIQNIKSERLKNIIKKLKTKNHRSIKSDLLTIGFKNLTLNKNISPKINNSLRINESKSKKKKLKDGNNFHNYNNSIIQKLTKINSSQVRLLKRKNIQSNDIRKKIGLNIIKNENNKNHILSLSFRDKKNYNNYTKINRTINNKTMNTLNETIRPCSHSRIINKIKNKADNGHIKNISSMQNIKSKKIIFNKKILINNNIPSKNKIPNNFNIRHDYLQKSENIKTLQIRNELLNNSIPKTKKFIYHKRCISNNFQRKK